MDSLSPVVVSAVLVTLVVLGESQVLGSHETSEDWSINRHPRRFDLQGARGSGPTALNNKSRTGSFTNSERSKSTSFSQEPSSSRSTSLSETRETISVTSTPWTTSRSPSSTGTETGSDGVLLSSTFSQSKSTVQYSRLVPNISTIQQSDLTYRDPQLLTQVSATQSRAIRLQLLGTLFDIGAANRTTWATEVSTQADNSSTGGGNASSPTSTTAARTSRSSWPPPSVRRFFFSRISVQTVPTPMSSLIPTFRNGSVNIDDAVGSLSTLATLRRSWRDNLKHGFRALKNIIFTEDSIVDVGPRFMVLLLHHSDGYFSPQDEYLSFQIASDAVVAKESVVWPFTVTLKTPTRIPVHPVIVDSGIVSVVAGSLLGVVVAPPIGFQAAKSLALLSLFTCASPADEYPPVYMYPVRIPVPWYDDADYSGGSAQPMVSRQVKYLSGQAVLNPAVILTILICHFWLAHLFAEVKGVKLKVAFGMVRFPHFSLLPAIYLSQQSITAITTLLLRQESAISITLAAVGVVFWIVLVGCCVGFGAVLFPGCRYLMYPETKQPSSLIVFFTGKGRWIDGDRLQQEIPTKSSPSPSRRLQLYQHCQSFGALFEVFDLGRQWFMLIESACVVAVAVVVAFLPDDGDCDNLNQALCVVFGVVALLQLVLAPYSSRMNQVSATLATLLNFSAALCALLARRLDPVLTQILNIAAISLILVSMYFALAVAAVNWLFSILFFFRVCGLKPPADHLPTSTQAAGQSTKPRLVRAVGDGEEDEDDEEFRHLDITSPEYQSRRRQELMEEKLRALRNIEQNENRNHYHHSVGQGASGGDVPERERRIDMEQFFSIPFREAAQPLLEKPTRRKRKARRHSPSSSRSHSETTAPSTSTEEEEGEEGTIPRFSRSRGFRPRKPREESRMKTDFLDPVRRREFEEEKALFKLFDRPPEDPTVAGGGGGESPNDLAAFDKTRLTEKLRLVFNPVGVQAKSNIPPHPDPADQQKPPLVSAVPAPPGKVWKVLPFQRQQREPLPASEASIPSQVQPAASPAPKPPIADADLDPDL